MLLVVVELVEIILGTGTANKLKGIPVSNDTVSRRIGDLLADIESQQLDRLCSSEYFTFQMAESPDIASVAQLIVSLSVGREHFGGLCFAFCHTFGIYVALCMDGAVVMRGWERRVIWIKRLWKHAVCCIGRRLQVQRYGTRPTLF